MKRNNRSEIYNIQLVFGAILIRGITAVVVVAGFWLLMADVLLLLMPMGLFI